MAKKPETYVDLDGRRLNLTLLDGAELQLISIMQKRARTRPDWNDFDNFWFAKVAAFYDNRGLSRTQAMRTVVYQIAQDLSARLALASGFARESDYRDGLRKIIRTRFQSRREFCAATGLSEDMMSHVLAGRKHLALDTLAQALQRIGYELRLVPFRTTSPRRKSRPQKVG
ncbi:MAG: hypothetical protein HY289_05010 [Planctomycetes bacterium]|nr:hypothetical protein [Planctomycetota bacterium]